MRGLPVLLRSATPRPFTTLLMCSLGARDLSEKSGATGVHGSHMGGRSVGQKKIRHHVNPLKDVHMRPLDLPPRWPEHHFADPLLPLHVDIGCARGVFCLDLATAAPELNVCGLEIRDLLAETASQDAKRLGLGNAAFFAANANVNLDALLSGAAETGQLQSVSIQYACKPTATASLFYSLALTHARCVLLLRRFPDPWFKKRHVKRRVVQPALIQTIASHLPPGGLLWMQSDVLDVASDMRETTRLAEPLRLRDARDDLDDWGVERPAFLQDVQTERERASAALERPVYRCLFVRSERDDDSAGGQYWKDGQGFVKDPRAA